MTHLSAEAVDDGEATVELLALTEIIEQGFVIQVGSLHSPVQDLV